MSSTLISEALQAEPKFRTALDLCLSALRRMAANELDPVINERMQELGERKEFLNQREHDELLSLVEFCERRTAETLEAKLALQRLGEVAPEILSQNP